MPAQQVVGPDANGTYTVLDENGQPIQQFSGASIARQMGMASPGHTTSLDEQGQVLPAPGAVTTQMPAEQGQSAAALPTSAPPATPNGTPWYAMPTDPGRRGGTSEMPAARGGTGYLTPTGSDPFAPPPSMGAPPPSFEGGYSSGASSVPTYRNGQTHPAMGGQPLTPGGGFAGTSDGDYAPAQTVYRRNYPEERTYHENAGTLSAGGSYPGMPGPTYGGRSTRGGNGSGGGTSALYDTFAAKGNAMEAKVRGMAGSIKGKLEGMGGGDDGGGYSGSTSTSSTKQYRREGRRMDRAYERYNDELADPDPLPVHGWSKAQGFKPGTISAALGDPTLLLQSAVPGYRSNNTAYSDTMESLPMTDLAIIMGGTHGKGLTTKTPVVKVPGILKKGGVKPIKPDFPRTLDPAAVANRVAAMYGSLGKAGGAMGSSGFLDQDTLLQKMATAKRGSALRTGLQAQFKEDPNLGMQSISSYLRSALSAGPDDLYHRALYRNSDQIVTNLGSRILRTNPKRADRLINTVANYVR
jgi:hypothetical protein